MMLTTLVKMYDIVSDLKDLVERFLLRPVTDPEESAQARSHRFLLPLRSFLLIPPMLFANWLVGLLTEVLAEGFFYNIVSWLKDPVLSDFLPTFALYTLLYQFLLKRKPIDQLFVWLGDRLLQILPNLQLTLDDIFYTNPATGKISLTKKWRPIRRQLFIICVTAFGFLVWACNSDNTEYSSVVVSISCAYCLGQYYRYLNLSNTDENLRRSNSKLDLFKLRIDYQEYADSHQVKMATVYKRTPDALRKKIQDVSEQYQHSGSGERLFLYRYLKDKGQLEHIDLASRLAEGENIFYASPFYKDIDGCIFFSIFLALLRNERCLILVEDNGQLPKLQQWLEDGLSELPGLRKLWNVAILNQTANNVEVGILPFQYLCAAQQVDGLLEFLQQVSFSVILEASDILIGGQETVLALAEQMKCEGKNRCSWLLCDWNAESMLDLFSHLLETQFFFVNATPLSARENFVTYWDVETEPNHIWDPAKRFLGLEVGIAEVAGKNQIPLVCWYGEEWMPVVDMNWIIGQYYQLYGMKIAQPVLQSTMETQFKVYISGNSCSVEPEAFLVVEDSCYNLYEVGRQYATRARDKACIHVISIDYLLRDFMKAHSETMINDPKYIAQFVPEYVNSMRNVYLHLLRRLLHNGVAQQEIEDSLNTFEELGYGAVNGEELEDMLKQMVAMLYGGDSKALESADFSVATDLQITRQNMFSEKKGKMESVLTYQITNKSVYTRFNRYFRQARYQDETGEKHYINQIMLAGHLPLKYLPGQFITLSGKYYQVEQLLEQEDEILLLVTRASEQVVERRYYRQLRKFAVRKDSAATKDPKMTKVIYQDEYIKLERKTLNFKAETYGYLTFRKRRRNTARVDATYFEEKNTLKCTYENKQMLCITLHPAIERADFLRLGAVLHEMFCTFYPKYYHLLSVAVRWDEESEGENGEKTSYYGVLSSYVPWVEKNDDSSEKEKERENRFFIIENSTEDMGLLRSIERHFVRIVQLVAEFVEWEDQNGLNYFS